MGATTSGQTESPSSLSRFSWDVERRAGGTTPDLPTGRYAAPLVDLDLVDTLRSTGAARQFQPEPVGDEVLERLLDTARFAPSGGNRQGWRVIVVKDPRARAALRDIYIGRLVRVPGPGIGRPGALGPA